ncbi:MAG: DUF3095 family protein [Bdellovibrionaceae bacterium]|nr:DUF3095 family protein [Pseudobdellovibrionaceae bacterium]
MFTESLKLYQTLRSFKDISSVTNQSHFIECPGDWSIIVSDIRSSTIAVQEGKYRDVNICGASIIALISEKMGTRNFPFVFGGDGSTVLLPTSALKVLSVEFSQLIHKIKANFKLELRIGVVPYSVIQSKGEKIFIGKLLISKENSLAQITGHGLAIAEDLVKKSSDYLIKEATSSELALISKLSCRFAPIPSRNGQILTLTVHPLVSTQDKDFVNLMAVLSPYFTNKQYRPITEKIEMDSFLKVLTKEFKIQGYSLKPFLSVTLVWLIAQIGKLIPLGDISRTIDNYFSETAENSDYLKFDGSLRSVIDCSEKDTNYILNELDQLQNRKIIEYGHFISKNAVTTCVVDDIRDHKHIHFIDGEGGGYTTTATIIKNRKR